MIPASAEAATLNSRKPRASGDDPRLGLYHFANDE